MKKSVNYISSLHSSTSRSYIERMVDNKIKHANFIIRETGNQQI